MPTVSWGGGTTHHPSPNRHPSEILSQEGQTCSVCGPFWQSAVALKGHNLVWNVASIYSHMMLQGPSTVMKHPHHLLAKHNLGCFHNKKCTEQLNLSQLYSFQYQCVIYCFRCFKPCRPPVHGDLYGGDDIKQVSGMKTPPRAILLVLPLRATSNNLEHKKCKNR